MKREYCLDIDSNVYTLGDLNMFLDNKEPISYPAVDSQNPTKPSLPEASGKKSR